MAHGLSFFARFSLSLYSLFSVLLTNAFEPLLLFEFYTKTDRGGDEGSEREAPRRERSNEARRLEATDQHDVNRKRRVTLFPVGGGEHRDGLVRSEGVGVHVLSQNGGAETGRGAAVDKLVPEGLTAHQREGACSGTEGDVEHTSEGDRSCGGAGDKEVRGGRVATREKSGSARDSEGFQIGPKSRG